MDNTENPDQSYWFVGAAFDERNDQTPRFLRDGIWEHGYDDNRWDDMVRSMRPGERIAIKAMFTRKHDLPFDNCGKSVSGMAIKAIGTITENMNDGKKVRVDWQKVEPKREWYFYTYRHAIWRVFREKDWRAEALLNFTFEGEAQDIDRFQNTPGTSSYNKFGVDSSTERFSWTGFYEAIAKRLLDYKDDRGPLIKGIHQFAESVGLKFQDKFSDDTKGPLNDICPFTTMGMFNRGMTIENRQEIAGKLANLLGVDATVPDSFEGIPVLDSRSSWFFDYAIKRNRGDIDALWRVFTAAAQFVDSDLPENREEFANAYDAATRVRQVAWNLSMGLYWAHPWDFPTLDSKSRNYIESKLGIPIPTSGQYPCDSEGYLELLDDLKTHFDQNDFPVHSFPELSTAAEDHKSVKTVQSSQSSDPYSITDILEDGCFLEKDEIQRFLERLREKKNLILQGSPGTGKTWMAKRLAFALMGKKDESRIRPVQFHPSLSYEDFVRGWRPSADGKLVLADGVFMETIRKALDDPESKFVIVIEEINRGNPAQVFGELLTLLEADKRTQSEAIELCYPDADGIHRRVHIPENLYVIGTMNIADRSLALVDLAFRRRFAFVTLEPKFNDAWASWIVKHRGVESDLVEEIKRRIARLNEHIVDVLGSQFKIGHSYVTPSQHLGPKSTREWFIDVANTEIGPLLEEYWFDSPNTAKDALKTLVADW